VGEVRGSGPDRGARAVEAAKGRLREAGRALSGRPPECSLDSLCDTLELWRDASSRWRGALERDLAAAAGYSPPNVREGLARGLEPFRGDALREVVRRELGRLGSQSGSGAPAASGFELTSLLLAGGIPMPTLLSMLLPLALHSPVLVKTASRDPVTAPLVAASLAEVDAELGRAVEVLSFSAADEGALSAFLDAPCVVANGSDETIAQVSARLAGGASPRRLVTHGHRLSLAVLGPEATRGEVLAQATQGLALDTALWDQLGCLSPVAVFVESPECHGSTERVAAALAEALAGAETRWPRGEIDARAAAAIQSERSKAEMRAAAEREVAVHAGPGTRWTVVLEDDTSFRPAPLHRFLRVHPVPDRKALLSALQPVARHLAAVAVAGFGGGGTRLAHELTHLGASRICRPGRLQSPPLGWNRDGQPLLRPLARLTPSL
jgi:hypothetical protein